MSIDFVSDTDDLAYLNFKSGCKNIIAELAVIYSGKERQIEMCFDRLIDNVPDDIVDAPITECLEDYLGNLKSNEFQKILKQDEIVEDSVCDTTISIASSEKAPSNLTELEDELVGTNKQEFKHLTSTVKKANGGKLKTLKEKIDEQSMIQEADEKTPTKEPKQDAKKIQDHVKSSKGTKYSLKVIYFLRDLTQITASLEELIDVNEKEIHENCLDDFKMISEAIASK